jgi:surfeit locus 1 family protein
MGFKNIITIVFLIGAIAIMVKLGFWQLDRLAWKKDVIEKLNAQHAVDPMSIALDLSNAKDFQRGYIEGRFLNKSSIHIAPRTNDGAVGYHVIAPFKTIAGDMILVNRGWVADGVNDYASPPRTNTKIAGYLQHPDKPNNFTPPNNIEIGQWYAITANDITAFYGDDFHDRMLYQEQPKLTAPQTFTDLPRPRNKHAQYATFWFFMAGLLGFLSGLYWFKKIKP